MSKPGKITVKDCIRWIRENCHVNTGSGIYNRASIYSEKEIVKAINSTKARSMTNG